MFVVGEQREDARMPAGNVLVQKPLEGSRIERGQTLDVVIAKAPVLVRVPAVVGLAVGEAKLRVEMVKLAVDKVTEQASETVPVGQVISQSLSEGSEVRTGTAIGLIVSKGAEMLQVPNVVGRSLTKAKDELQKAGFKPGNVRSRSDEDHSDGLILEQTPAANQNAAKGSAIDLVVNRT
jgi:serine/threonine-protein kinase